MCLFLTPVNNENSRTWCMTSWKKLEKSLWFIPFSFNANTPFIQVWTEKDAGWASHRVLPLIYLFFFSFLFFSGLVGWSCKFTFLMMSPCSQSVHHSAPYNHRMRKFPDYSESSDELLLPTFEQQTSIMSETEHHISSQTRPVTNISKG